MQTQPIVTTQPTRWTSDPATVLLAEDDDELRRLIGGKLRRLGYVVIEARDGDRLRALVRALLQSDHSDPPELVITDVRMPGMSGLEVLRALREHDWYTPVILMTGFGSPSVESAASELGATVVLAKPVPIDELERRVLELVPIQFR